MGENFRRKARFVAGGHTVEVPESLITYSSVVSRDSVRIALTIAGLNGLQVMACNIQNAYLLTAGQLQRENMDRCRPRVWLRSRDGVPSQESPLWAEIRWGRLKVAAGHGSPTDKG